MITNIKQLQNRHGKKQFNKDKEGSLPLKSISLSKKYHIYNLHYVHSSRH